MRAPMNSKLFEGKIMDGKKVAHSILLRLKEKIKKMETPPLLSIVLCGEDLASKVYVSMKQKKAQEIGINAKIYELPANVSEEELSKSIKELNLSSDGVMIQLPLPKHLDVKKILEYINPEKDVDGLTPTSLGKLMQGDELLAPATPKAVIRLLENYNIELRGAHVTIINRSSLIGKPLSLMLLQRGATVTVCHKSTKNIMKHTSSSEIVISAVGIPEFIKGPMIMPGAVVIDVGITKDKGKVKGDVDAISVLEKAKYISPVPGGIGPMTIAMLLETLVELKFQKLSTSEK